MKKLFSILIVGIIAMAIPLSAFAASIGQVLSTPEDGWKRYDSDTQAIGGEGVIENGASNLAYRGNEIYVKELGGKFKFKFEGTQIRLLAGRFDNRSDSIEIYIDGVLKSTVSEYGAHTGQVLIFEEMGLDNKIHTVEMVNKSTTTHTYMSIDAIDINTSGYLIGIHKLKATPGAREIILEWEEFKGAQNYIVMRSLTSGGPYTEIGSVNSSTFIDTSVERGTEYFYKVFASNRYGEIFSSNEASATLQGKENPQPTGDRAILVVTMTTGLEKEFDLSMTEVNAFIDWYEAKSNGIGSAKFAIDKHGNNKGPFSSRKDYVIFDKILTFEVNEYTTK